MKHYLKIISLMYKTNILLNREEHTKRNKKHRIDLTSITDDDTKHW